MSPGAREGDGAAGAPLVCDPRPADVWQGCDSTGMVWGGPGLLPVLVSRGITGILDALRVQKQHVLVSGWVSWQPQRGFGCAGIWKLP